MRQIGLERWKNIATWIAFAFLVCLLGACNANKLLTEGDYFLDKNSVDIESDVKVKNKGSLKSSLEDFYRQEESRYFLGIPRRNFYYAGRNNPDSTWFKKWLRNKIGDDPVVFDSVAADETSASMVRYLHDKGYWNATVNYEIKYNATIAEVEYIADPGKRWDVRDISYRSRDSTLQGIMDSLAEYTILEPGEPVDIELYEKDRLRITRSMQNLGYAMFFKNYINRPYADSSDYLMGLQIDILDPPEAKRHKVYSIGEIRVFPDFTNDEAFVVDTLIDSIRYISPTYPLLVKPGVLRRSIFFNKGDRYKYDDIEKTKRQLNKLPTYSFVAVKSRINPEDSTVLDYDITLTRNKTMGIGGNVEVNYSTLSASAQNLFGIGVDLSYRHRNLFGGAEFFTSSLETGIEFNFNRNPALINTVNINWLNSLSIPRFIDPLKFYTGLNRLKVFKRPVLSDKVFEWIRDDNSQINLNYQFLSLVTLYDYQSVNFSIGYDAQPEPSKRLQLNHFGIEFFSPTTKPQFDTILQDNRFLQQSFRPQFFTGVLFKDYRFTHTGAPNRNGLATTVIHSAEISGLEVMGINALVNALGNHEGAFLINDTIRFAQFIKLDLDTRFTKLLKGNQQLAFRAAAGVAFPYGPFSERVPYVKQFYIGGPQSLRAWQIRELGPGGYEDPNVPENTNQFYQSGDIRLEFAAEYRFKIGWIFNGAVFMEAGNVWTVESDPDRPGAAFSTSFLREMAIGTGAGLRLDFEYFVIRWDLGYKLRNPFPDEEGDYWLWKNFNDFSFSQFNSNFAIGYPF